MMSWLLICYRCLTLGGQGIHALLHHTIDTAGQCLGQCLAADQGIIYALPSFIFLFVLVY